MTDTNSSIHYSPDLWEQAAKELGPEDRKRIELLVDPQCNGNVNLLSEVLKATEERKQQCIKKQWSFTMKSGKVIKMRDLCDKILDWTQKFEKVGDFLASMDVSGHAALPWAGVKFVLEVTKT
jgi:hypothetical protein